MGNLTQEQLAALIANVVGQGLAGQTATPKAATAKPHFLPKGAKAAPSDLASKDAQIVAAFARKGFKVTLMDRNDPDKPYDVRPFKGWLEMGRIVRRGSKGIRGLFHVTQTDPLPTKASPKTAPAQPKAAPKGKFGRAKPKLHPVA